MQNRGKHDADDDIAKAEHGAGATAATGTTPMNSAVF